MNGRSMIVFYGKCLKHSNHYNINMHVRFLSFLLSFTLCLNTNSRVFLSLLNPVVSWWVCDCVQVESGDINKAGELNQTRRMALAIVGEFALQMYFTLWTHSNEIHWIRLCIYWQLPCKMRTYKCKAENNIHLMPNLDTLDKRSTAWRVVEQQNSITTTINIAYKIHVVEAHQILCPFDFPVVFWHFVLINTAATTAT